jgi:anti-sigma regulatory factor (Ser/Thr protein kinase)
VPLLLAGATGATAVALTRNAMRRQVPVYPCVADAVAAAHRERPCGRLQLHLRPTTAAAAQARLLVKDACAVWGLDHLSEVAALISSELVENAVFHARTECVFTVAYRGRYLHLSVEDRVPAPARLRLREVEPGDPVGGRGLRLIQAFATAWGTFPTPHGKTTWATVEAA